MMAPLQSKDCSFLHHFAICVALWRCCLVCVCVCVCSVSVCVGKAVRCFVRWELGSDRERSDETTLREH